MRRATLTRQVVDVDALAVRGRTVHDVVDDYLTDVVALESLCADDRAIRRSDLRAEMASLVDAAGQHGPTDRRPPVEGVRITDHTLLEVVARYLAELDNPAPDFTMRRIYRDWMRQFFTG